VQVATDPTNVYDMLIIVIPSIVGGAGAIAAAYFAYQGLKAGTELKKAVATVSEHVVAVREQGTAAAALTTAAATTDAITAAVAAGMQSGKPPFLPTIEPEQRHEEIRGQA